MWPDNRVRVSACGSAIGFCTSKEKNVDLLSIIPQEQASLEGMVQQKQGHCGWWMAGSNLVEAVVCWRGFWADLSPRGESNNNQKEREKKKRSFFSSLKICVMNGAQQIQISQSGGILIYIFIQPLRVLFIA